MAAVTVFCEVLTLRVASRILPAVFLFRRRDFCYDHMTSQPLQIFFLFICSCNFQCSACVTSFFALSGASFFVHLRD